MNILLDFFLGNLGIFGSDLITDGTN